MLRGLIITVIIMLLLLGPVGGVMSSEFREAKDKCGHFKGRVFDNGHIMVKIKKDYAVIKDSASKKVLVKRAYPVVEIKRGGGWEAVEFEEKFIVKSNYNGWHVVAVGMVHHGDIEIRGFLEYYQKKKVKIGEPLYPLLLLYFNKSVEYRVVWRYEGIATNYFEVIDNGTGYTRPPFKEGHERRVIYNGTVHGDMEFEDNQDIVKTWKNGTLLFGLNWEREKMRFKKLIIHGGDDVSMEIAEEPGRGLRYGDTGGFMVTYTPPAPDQGGGGSSVDSDGDGLSDSVENAGWYIWVCTSGTTWHHIKVYSNPHYKDTDNDGVNDKVEYDHGTNSQDSDTDNDGLSDKQEIVEYGTCAYNWDSDEDELSDKIEIEAGRNPHLKDLYGLTLVISIQWDADYSYLEDFVDGMRKASSYLFDVTDGYLYIKEIKLYDRGVNWVYADIHVYYDDIRPMADVGGIKSTRGYIYLPHNWNGYSYPWGYSWTNSSAYRTIVHELGHYAMFLYDEYRDADKRKYPGTIPQGPRSFMNYQYEYSEMSSEVNYTHWSPPPGYKTTEQWAHYHESCWKTFFRMYNSVNGEYIKAIEFDLDGDGRADTTFWNAYVPLPGPTYDIGAIMEVEIHDT